MTVMNMPSSSGAQAGAILAAENLVTTLNHASDRLAGVRADVDMEIRYEIADLNDKLYELVDLNTKLHTYQQNTFEAAAYSDRIESIIDEISSMVDVRVSYGSAGWVNLYTTGGAALMEGDQVQDVSYNAGGGRVIRPDTHQTAANRSARVAAPETTTVPLLLASSKRPPASAASLLP